MDVDLNANGVFIYYGTAWWTVKNLTNPAGMAAFSGQIGVTVDSTVTDGYVYLTGPTVLDADNKTGGTVVTAYKDSFKVWDENLYDHTTASGAGKLVRGIKTDTGAILGQV
jgi:hypothetical protein